MNQNKIIHLLYIVVSEAFLHQPSFDYLPFHIDNKSHHIRSCYSNKQKHCRILSQLRAKKKAHNGTTSNNNSNNNNKNNYNVQSHPTTNHRPFKSTINKSSRHKQEFEESGGILYRTSVLSDEEFDSIRNELLDRRHRRRLRLQDETISSAAKNRLVGRLPPDGMTVKILEDPGGSVSRLVNSIVLGSSRRRSGEKNGEGSGMVLSKELPVEIRIYEKTGAGMEWHVDDILFEPEQLEVVLTIQNDSDCVTMWEEKKRIKGNNSLGGQSGRIVKVETEPNSALVIQAGGVRHKVTPLKTGKRVILKFVYVMVGSKMLDEAQTHIDQFQKTDGRRRKKPIKRIRSENGDNNILM